MSLTELAAVAEIVSSAAIVATLVYLALQTRQNTDALLSATRQSFLEAELEYLYQNVNRPDAEAAFGLPMPEMPDDGLDPETFRQARVFSLAFLRMRESLWLNFNSGALDAEVWESYRTVLLNALERSELFRIMWDFYSPGFATGFRQEINSRLG